MRAPGARTPGEGAPGGAAVPNGAGAGEVTLVVAAGQLEPQGFGPPTQPQGNEALAQAEPEAPNEADTAAAAPATSPIAAPAGSAPAWLAPPRTTTVASGGGVGWTPWVLLLGLSAVGGALFLQRNKVRQRVKRQFGKAEIHVLASSRVGPKAHTVAIEFAGKVYLLGVTDTSVRRLETLSKEDVQASIAVDPNDSRYTPQAPLEGDDDDFDGSREERSRLQPGPFRAYLDSSLKRADTGASAAEQLAQNLTDRTSLKGRGKPDLVDIEGQAAGLAARLNSTTGGPKRNR
jgi:flagellar biogenesis protein FliO